MECQYFDNLIVFLFELYPYVISISVVDTVESPQGMRFMVFGRVLYLGLCSVSPQASKKDVICQYLTA